MVVVAHWLIWIKWIIWLIGPGYSDKLLVFGSFLPEAKKAAPLCSASIIRATCTFDAKEVLEYRFVILVTRFGKVS
jgi:hypothetical protein